MDGGLDEWMDRCIAGRINGWIDGRTNEWMNEW